MGKPSATVAWIAVAPIKAMALSFIARADVTRDGIAGDRAFAILDTTGRLVNGKNLGSLATLRPEWDPATSRLAIRFPDGTEVAGTVEPGRPIPASIYGKLRPARAVGDPWDEALSGWAGRPLHLAFMGRGEGIDREGTVSLLSTAALASLAEAGGTTVPLDRRRFRMSFGIDGVAAHTEDAWLGQRMQVGGAVLRVGGNVGRCAVTTHDPDTGRPSFDTLRVLHLTRGHLPTTEPLPFGVWADVEADGGVVVGDPIDVLGP